MLIPGYFHFKTVLDICHLSGWTSTTMVMDSISEGIDPSTCGFWNKAPYNRLFTG